MRILRAFSAVLLAGSGLIPVHAQPPLIPVALPTPPGYNYRYKVIVQSYGPFRTKQGDKTVQAFLQYALSENGTVAFLAQFDAPAEDRGRVALLLNDGTIVAESEAKFNGRWIKRFRDILGFGTGGTLYFVAESTASKDSKLQPDTTFFGTDGTAFVPTGTVIGGCTLNMPPNSTQWAFSPTKNDFAFVSPSESRSQPRAVCGSGYFTRAQMLTRPQQVISGLTPNFPKSARYRDQLYYLANAGINNALHLFSQQREIAKMPAGLRGYDVSPNGNILLAYEAGIVPLVNHNPSYDLGNPIVPDKSIIDDYRVTEFADPLQTAAGIFFRARFDYQRPPGKEHQNSPLPNAESLHNGVDVFTKGGPVFPVLQEAMAPWRLHLALNVTPYFANDAGQVLGEMVIGLRYALILATPGVTKQ